MSTTFKSWAGITFIAAISLWIINEVIVGCENGAHHLTIAELPFISSLAFMAFGYFRKGRE